MKLAYNSNIIDSDLDGLQKSRFSFKTGPKMFEILSSSLYSDKIGSIVRELACNAWDSHVMAGKSDVPFEIILPDRSIGELNSVFIIRDFGTGISPENIYKIYSCYGESTKTDSDDVIGAFGLGSKTPFCYTNEFTIISTWEGIRKSYLIFIDNEGYPTITELSSCDTSDSNGFEVRISIKESDEHLFEAAVNKQLLYMIPHPIIKNSTQDKLELPEVIFSGDSWALHDAGKGLYIKAGNIQYPVEDMSYFPNDLTRFVGLFKNILLDFNVGELDLSVSRESLQYTTKTKEAIVRKLTTLIPTFFAHINSYNDIGEVILKLTSVKKHRSIKDFCYIIKDLAAKYNIDSNLTLWQGLSLKEFKEAFKVSLFINPAHANYFRKIPNLYSINQSKVNRNTYWNINRNFANIENGHIYPEKENIAIVFSHVPKSIDKEIIEKINETDEAFLDDYVLYICPKKILRTEYEKRNFDKSIERFASKLFTKNVKELTNKHFGIVTDKVSKAKQEVNTFISAIQMTSDWKYWEIHKNIREKFRNLTDQVPLFIKKGKNIEFLDPGPEYSFVLFDNYHKVLNLSRNMKQVYLNQKNIQNVLVIKTSDYERLGKYNLKGIIDSRLFTSKVKKAFTKFPTEIIELKMFKEMINRKFESYNTVDILNYKVTKNQLAQILKHMGSIFNRSSDKDSNIRLIALANQYSKFMSMSSNIKSLIIDGIEFEDLDNFLSEISSDNSSIDFSGFFDDFMSEITKYPMLLSFSDTYYINDLHINLIRNYVN